MRNSPQSFQRSETYQLNYGSAVLTYDSRYSVHLRFDLNYSWYGTVRVLPSCPSPVKVPDPLGRRDGGRCTVTGTVGKRDQGCLFISTYREQCDDSVLKIVSSWNIL